MNKKELLNEIMGVPKVLTPWVNSITKIIINHLNNLGEDSWFDYATTEYNDGEIDVYLDTLTIDKGTSMDVLTKLNGFSDVKDFIKSDMFTNLPLWKPKLVIKLVAIPKYIYDEEKPKISASLNYEIDQELSKLGKITIMSNVVINMNVVVPFGDYNNIDFLKELKSTISHELLHAYQKFKQMEGGSKSHFGRETILNSLTNFELFKEINITWWDEFLYLVYLHLSFEINARVTQLYYEVKEKNLKTKDDIIKEVYKSDVWKQLKMLEEFDAENFISTFKSPLPNIDNPLKTLHDFIESHKLNLMGVDVESDQDIIKSLIRIWDETLRIGSETIKKTTGIDFNMMPVPKSSKQDPYQFFKFFEKRFHKKADKFKKKLHKVISLLVNELE